LEPLNVFPNTKPPISVEIQIKITKKKSFRKIFLSKNADKKDRIKKTRPNKK